MITNQKNVDETSTRIIALARGAAGCLLLLVLLRPSFEHKNNKNEKVELSCEEIHVWGSFNKQGKYGVADAEAETQIPVIVHAHTGFCVLIHPQMIFFLERL
mmetsp:Transcript_78943/g.173140  ORF Transcript_78943/g.173140 Transcript_78943/m.173140 type:complete len:102 (-) Transcript_78943:19-324(-)